MKKAVLISLVLILVGIGAYLASRLFAQGARQAVPTTPGTKVAVVNIRAVLKENAKSKALQAELEETLKPHKARAMTLKEEIDRLTAQPNGRLTNVEGIRKKTLEWEAVNSEILRVLEQKHKEKLPAVWNDINYSIDALAKAYGFKIVLGYGNPDDPELRKLLSVKASMLGTADLGCTIMPYIHGSVDITPVVIQMLERPVSPPRR